jgi:hypothetical protein
LAGEPRAGRRRWSRVLAAGLAVLGAVASLIAIIQFGSSVFKSSDHTSARAEAKQIVAFHQVTNRMCTENQQDLERALSETHRRVELLGFLSRGVGWGINDLESVTAPPSLAGPFAEEIAMRQKLQGDLLELQRSSEIGDLESKEQAGAAIAGGEESARELEHELGLRRCAPMLPTKVRLVIGVA